jgi:hypothetical protein
MRRSRAFVAIGAVAGLAAVVAYSASALSADHQDAPGTKSAPTADINDVFSWMNGSNIDLAMTVYPAAPTGAQFDDHVQYVLHTASQSAYGATTSTPVDIIATFDNSTPQNISLWVGTTEFVTGNAGLTSGLESADGKVKVFAGLRADPFFFNLDGFKATAADVAAATGLTFNDAGCPLLPSATASALVGQLGTAPDGGAAANHFATFNTLAILVEVNKSLLTTGGPIVSTWAGTYATAPIGDAGGQ